MSYIVPGSTTVYTTTGSYSRRLYDRSRTGGAFTVFSTFCAYGQKLFDQITYVRDARTYEKLDDDDNDDDDNDDDDRR